MKVEINLLGYVTKKLHFCNTDGILFFSDYPNALYCRHGGLIARTLFSGWRDPISKHGQDYCLLFDFPLTLLTLFFSFCSTGRFFIWVTKCHCCHTPIKPIFIFRFFHCTWVQSCNWLLPKLDIDLSSITLLRDFPDPIPLKLFLIYFHDA